MGLGLTSVIIPIEIFWKIIVNGFIVSSTSLDKCKYKESLIGIDVITLLRAESGEICIAKPIDITPILDQFASYGVYN
jgi:hypothetical protein